MIFALNFLSHTAAKKMFAFTVPSINPMNTSMVNQEIVIQNWLSSIF